MKALRGRGMWPCDRDRLELLGVRSVEVDVEAGVAVWDSEQGIISGPGVGSKLGEGGNSGELATAGEV
jgi:hypothetical protein